jgi:hypothetical protein
MGSIASGQDAGAGSVAIGGAARSNLLAGADPDDPDSFVLASIKNNLGPKPVSLRYHIEEVGIDSDDGLIAVPVIRWDGEVMLQADDLAGGGEKRGEAYMFLSEILADGPMLAKDIEKAAKARGLSWGGEVRRVSERMNIDKRKRGIESGELGGAWEWELLPD